MFAGLISFLGGSAFRMIWGEVSSYFSKKQDHAQEMERMKLQGDLDAAQHARNMEAIKLQADLGVKTIEAQAEADVGKLETQGWVQAITDVGKQVGIKWVDAWNGIIRPALATEAALVVLFEVIKNHFGLSDWDRELVGAILGVYVADRSLTNRGK